MQFARVNTRRNYLATLLTNKLSFMFQSKVLMNNKVVTDGAIRQHKAPVDFKRKNNGCLSC